MPPLSPGGRFSASGPLFWKSAALRRHPQRGCESGSMATALQSSRKTRAGSLLESNEKLFMTQDTSVLSHKFVSLVLWQKRRSVSSI